MIGGLKVCSPVFKHRFRSDVGLDTVSEGSGNVQPSSIDRLWDLILEQRMSYYKLL